MFNKKPLLSRSGSKNSHCNVRKINAKQVHFLELRITKIFIIGNDNIDGNERQSNTQLWDLNSCLKGSPNATVTTASKFLSQLFVIFSVNL